MRWMAAAVAAVAIACGGGSERVRPCASNDDCAPEGGNPAICIASPRSSSRWCAIEGTVGCASGRRWSALAGDELAGECVLPMDLPDAGTPDATLPTFEVTGGVVTAGGPWQATGVSITDDGLELDALCAGSLCVIGGLVP